MAQAITIRPFDGVSTFNSNAVQTLKSTNRYALISVTFVGIFILYFLLPHTGILHTFFSLNVLYIVFLPIAAFTCAVIALRQINTREAKGKILSMIALAVTSLYFMVALAIPVVLVGLYLLYSYVI